MSPVRSYQGGSRGRSNRELRVAAADAHDLCFMRLFPAAKPSRFELYRQLNFELSRFDNDDEIEYCFETVARCLGLRTIKLSLEYMALTFLVQLHKDEDGLTSYPRSADDLMQWYQLKCLLECDTLQTVIIEVIEPCHPAKDAAMRLGDLLEAESANKVQKQIISVEHA
jgi:hypothetical protein